MITQSTFTLPTDPGLYPSIPTSATSAKIKELKLRHEIKHSIFQTQDATDKLLKQLLLTAVDPQFIYTLSEAVYSFTNKTTWELLDYLIDTYGVILSTHLKQSEIIMKTSYDPTQPFEKYIAQVENGFNFTKATKTPYLDKQVLKIAINGIISAHCLQEEFKKWNRLKDTQKTWATFKTHFGRSHRELTHNEDFVTQFSSNFESSNELIPSSYPDAPNATNELSNQNTLLKA